MKTVTIKISAIYLLLLFVIVSSCKKSFDEKLDVIPRDRLTDASVWADQGTADVFLNDVYGKLPDCNNSYDPFDNWSDNSICGFAWPNSRNLAQQASYTPSTVAFWGTLPLEWNTLYSNIRKTNVFIEKVTSSSLPDDFKKGRLAEAKFLRAYFYHLVWMCYGGAPVITEPLDVSTQGDSVFHERNTFDETYAFIISDLVAAANDLGATNDAGRATKGAALTLKGWCELFAHKYTDAAATNKLIIETLGNGIVYDLFSDYGTLFLPEGNSNKEGIFYRQYIPRVLGGRYDSYNGPTFTKGGAETAWGGVNPTQELIDDYAMDNGLPITDLASGYNQQKPYVNREKRFYQSIVYDGSYWYDDTIFTRQGIGSPNEIDLSDASDATQTGYYLRKACNDKIPLGADNWDGGTGGQNFYYFRYAEVLLNYAEAQNEALGPDASVYDAINKIRTRAALPALPAGLDQTQMRTAIRKERRVELVFENKRWWDLIRWGTAEINLNQKLHGISIKDGIDGTLVYTPVIVVGGDRKFNAAKNYLFPIPQGAIDQNSKLVQNPGY